MYIDDTIAAVAQWYKATNLHQANLDSTRSRVSSHCWRQEGHPVKIAPMCQQKVQIFCHMWYGPAYRTCLSW